MRDKSRKIPRDFDEQFKAGENMHCGIAGTVSMKEPAIPGFNPADWEMRNVKHVKTTRCEHKDDSNGYL
jgi:Fe-S oxidoreductase